VQAASRCRQACMFGRTERTADPRDGCVFSIMPACIERHNGHGQHCQTRAFMMGPGLGIEKHEPD